MSRMLTFDSFTLIPTYSDIESRNDVDISTNICGVESQIPIINANMLSICSKDMMDVLHDHHTFSSYHRFFNSKENRIKALTNLKKYKDHLFTSLGTKKEEYDFATMLREIGFKNFIVDVNHGHHKMVENIVRHVKDISADTVVMAGNVSSVNGILYLQNAGADIIKIGNSFGFSCTTIKQTGFGAHPIDTAIRYNDYLVNKKREHERVKLCIDGGIRDVSDIAKSLIYGDVVMLGRMFAGSTESFGRSILTGDLNSARTMKEYFGNASVKTKQVIDEENHVRHVEGTTKLVPHTGPLSDTLASIKEGLQSAFSFVGARNIKEYQERAKHQVLKV